MGLPFPLVSIIAAFFLGTVMLRILLAVSRGSRVVVPWLTNGMPGRMLFGQRLRTRDGSRLVVRDPDYCALVFWKAAPKTAWDFRVVDVLSGFSHVQAVSVDFSHHDGNGSWFITSHVIHSSHWSIDGPHFMPASSSGYSAWVPVQISSLIDVPRLRQDLERVVSEECVRHRGLDPIGYLLGLNRSDRVTCSGLLGNAILSQGDVPFANALRQALKERLTYGEITPVDLARAAAILGLIPEGASRPITAVPLFKFDRAPARLETRRDRRV